MWGKKLETRYERIFLIKGRKRKDVDFRREESKEERSQQDPKL